MQNEIIKQVVKKKLNCILLKFIIFFWNKYLVKLLQNIAVLANFYSDVINIIFFNKIEKKYALANTIKEIQTSTYFRCVNPHLIAVIKLSYYTH